MMNDNINIDNNHLDGQKKLDNLGQNITSDLNTINNSFDFALQELKHAIDNLTIEQNSDLSQKLQKQLEEKEDTIKELTKENKELKNILDSTIKYLKQEVQEINQKKNKTQIMPKEEEVIFKSNMEAKNNPESIDDLAHDHFSDKNTQHELPSFLSNQS